MDFSRIKERKRKFANRAFEFLRQDNNKMLWWYLGQTFSSFCHMFYGTSMKNLPFKRSRKSISIGKNICRLLTYSNKRNIDTYLIYCEHFSPILSETCHLLEPVIIMIRWWSRIFVVAVLYCAIRPTYLCLCLCF